MTPWPAYLPRPSPPREDAGPDPAAAVTAGARVAAATPTPPPQGERPDTARGLQAIFSPHQGLVADTGERLEAETGKLLRSRLLAISIFFAATIVAFMGRSLLVGDAGLPLVVEQGVALGLVLVCCGMLSRARAGGLRRLRILEATLMVTMAVHLLWTNHHVATSFTAEGDPVGAMTALYRLAMAFFGLMVAYGTFVPNTWGRTAVVSTSLALAPIALVAALIRFHEDVREAFEAAATLDDLTFGVVFLVVGATLATYGSHVIHSMRTSAVRQAEMGMYRLEEELASGGMGQVWRARHRLLARPAAIKMIRPELADDGDALQELVTRFEREARATAQLTSPHTVDLYDFGVTDDGLFYYVMEYLEGVNLERLVERFGPQSPARTVHLVRQAAESLHEAHERGLIHRDIKPSNVYLTHKGGRHDFIKVLDFGLVKPRGERARAALAEPPGGPADEPAADPGVTGDGSPRGTPAFMAPELALQGHDVDHRCDIYALGCVGYWLLTGRFVFDTADPVQQVVEHVRGEPVPPSRVSELEIPEELERLLMACLAKDPADRPSGTADLLEALDACPLEHPWTDEDATLWWELHLAPGEAASSRPEI